MERINLIDLCSHKKRFYLFVQSFLQFCHHAIIKFILRQSRFLSFLVAGIINSCLNCRFIGDFPISVMDCRIHHIILWRIPLNTEIRDNFFHTVSFHILNNVKDRLSSVLYVNYLNICNQIWHKVCYFFIIFAKLRHVLFYFFQLFQPLLWCYFFILLCRS